MSKRSVVIKEVCNLNSETIGSGSRLEEIQYLDTGNITCNRIDNIQILNKNEMPFPSRAQRKVKDKTIIYSTVRPIQEHFGFLANPADNFIVSTGFLTIDVKDQDIDPRFLYYALTQKHITAYLQTVAVNNVSSYPSINPDDVGNLEFDIPKEKQQQRKIAAVLSVIDEKIELNHRINAELESVAKALYDYWFIQFDFPNVSGEPYKSSGGKMEWNKILKKEIPQGWVVENLFDAMEVQYGFPFSTVKFTDKMTDKPVIRIRDILKNTISTYTTEVVDDKYRLLQNDLLIGMDGNFHMNFWDKDGAYLNQRSVRIRAREHSTVSNFQAYFELSPHIKAREKNVSRTTVGHLSDKDLKRLFIISSVQTDYFHPKEIFDSLLERIILSRLENQALAEQRDWLLPMLMNGQVRVS